MYRTHVLTATLALAVWLSACNNNDEAQVQQPAPVPVADTVPEKYESPVPQGVNAITFPEDGYKQYDPVQFVAYLQEHEANGTVLITQAPKGWIQKKHLKPLAALLDDKTHCAGVLLQSSGPNPPDNIRSTVAAEALLLLESYKQGAQYPAVPGSLQFIKVLQSAGEGRLMLFPQKQQLDDMKTWVDKQ